MPFEVCILIEEEWANQSAEIPIQENVGRVDRTVGMIQQVTLSHLGAANQAGCT